VRRKLALALLVIVAGAATGAMAKTGSQVVKTRTDASLGTILVNARSRTLYHLQGETVHHFMCTGSSCTGLWPPLVVKSSSAISHSKLKHLGTVKRPDNHKLQVTYKGEPLYTYSHDSRPGDTNGEGFAGVWHAVVTKKKAAPPQQQSPPPYSPSPSPSPYPPYPPGY
jgi:predicted lipoprotein with Yx(FWY)xxD motif